MEIEIRGVNETVDRLTTINERLDNPGPAMQEATAVLTSAARRNAPVDQGVLRASILPSVTSGGWVGVVGSNLAYAPAQELGTGPFWPPIQALEAWARRHGTVAFLVARAISRRGIRARRFLQRALDDNVQRVIRIFIDYVAKVAK